VAKGWVVVGAIAVAGALPAASPERQAQPPPQEVERYVWELSSIFPDTAAWEAERAAILGGITAGPAWRETPRGGAAGLLRALDAISDRRARATRMTIHGELAHNLDRRSSEAQRFYEVGTDLVGRVEAAVAYLPEEVRRFGADRLGRLYREEP